MRTYSDEHIEYWAEVYVAYGIRQQRILLETFLQNPNEILDAIFLMREPPEQDGYRPLLQAQRAVERRLFGTCLEEIEERHLDPHEVIATTGPSAVLMRGGRLIEPLHHHIKPKRSGRSMFRRDAPCASS